MYKEIGIYIWSIIKYTSIILRFYLYKFQISGKEKIPTNGPIIFAVNHQNAFLDAIILSCSSPRFPYSLARADVFKSVIGRFLLKSINIMPIYRFRDGFSAVKKTSQVIQNCVALLKQNKALLIFPEGNHYLRFNLRPFQKGIARIAFGDPDQSLTKKLKIIPVGIQYEHHSAYRGRVLVTYGDPIEVGGFSEEYQKNPRSGINLLLEEVHYRMKQLIVDIPENNYQEICKKWLDRREIYYDLEKQLKSDQIIVRSIIDNSTQQVFDIKPKFSLGKLFYLITNMVLVTILSIPILLVKFIISKFIKDVGFEGSMKFSLWLAILPIFYIGLASTIWFITHQWTIIIGFILIVPITAKLSGYFKYSRQ
jgi:1-acyl-sn-glycerol-3-phosphate acyltransferase